MSTRTTICAELERIAAEGTIRRLPPLTDDLVLLDSGIDSLAIAILVTRLEESLGVDPFSASDEVQFPVTLGDFVRFYEQAVQ